MISTETEIHRGSMLAWRLPELPRALRDQLGYEGFRTPPAMILPAELTVPRKPLEVEIPDWNACN